MAIEVSQTAFMSAALSSAWQLFTLLKSFLLSRVCRKARVRTIKVWIYLRLPGPKRLRNLVKYFSMWECTLSNWVKTENLLSIPNWIPILLYQSQLLKLVSGGRIPTQVIQGKDLFYPHGGYAMNNQYVTSNFFRDDSLCTCDEVIFASYMLMRESARLWASSITMILFFKLRPSDSRDDFDRRDW